MLCYRKDDRAMRFGEKLACMYHNVFWVGLRTLIISGTGKATNFKFRTHIHSINWKKSPLKISGKVAVGVVRDYRKFSGHRTSLL